MSLFKTTGIISGLIFLQACDNTVNHTAVTIDSNAYYSVYQKSNTSDWTVLDHSNLEFDLKTITFNVDSSNSTVGMAFVCPSTRGDLPHEVFVFYSTPAELEVLDFKCRKASEELIQKPVYGKIAGVNIKSEDPLSPISVGEIAHLSFSNEVSVDGLEAYAAIVPSGRRDVVAFKGAQSLDKVGVQNPEWFYIQRSILLALDVKPRELNIDFEESNSQAYIKKFDPTKRSTINITGLTTGESVEAQVGFLSQHKTYLNLAKSDGSSFDFLPVPLSDRENDEVANLTHFNEQEGHELSVSVSDASGNLSRQVVKFFGESDAETHSVNLPLAINTPPSMSVSNKGKLQSVAATWKAFSDSASGKTALYQWDFLGKAAVLPGDLRGSTIGKVNWIVTVTPGWLNATNKSVTDYSLILPSDFSVEVLDQAGDSVKVWSEDWGFSESSAVDWQLKALTVSNENRPQEIIDYLLNRNIASNFTFTQSVLRGTIAP